MSLLSMVSKTDLAGESTPMATYDINPTKCDISPISDTSTTKQACIIDQDMSVDKQIPVEVPVSADSHPINGQNSDSDTDLSLSIMRVTQDLWIPGVHTVEGIMQYVPV